MGLPVWLSGKEPSCNAGVPRDAGSIPRSGRFPGGRHGNLLQYSCLEKPMDRGAWRAIVHGVHKESDMTEWLTEITNEVWPIIHLCPFLHKPQSQVSFTNQSFRLVLGPTWNNWENPGGPTHPGSLKCKRDALNSVLLLHKLAAKVVEI